MIWKRQTQSFQGYDAERAAKKDAPVSPLIWLSEPASRHLKSLRSLVKLDVGVCMMTACIELHAEVVQSCTT